MYMGMKGATLRYGLTVLIRLLVVVLITILIVFVIFWLRYWWGLQARCVPLLVGRHLLLVAGLVFLGHCLVLGLGRRAGVCPPSAQLLGDVAHTVLWVLALNLATLVVAEPEESRPKTAMISDMQEEKRFQKYLQRSLGSVRVLDLLAFLAPDLLALGRGVILHLAVVALLVLLGHLVETLLLLVQHGLKQEKLCFTKCQMQVRTSSFLQ